MKPQIALIGPGKVGCAVACRLQQAGYTFSVVIGRNQASAADACQFIGCPPAAADCDLAAAGKASIILLAVKDDQIADLAEKLCARVELSSEQTLIHFSGLHPAAIMQRRTAAATLSIHPLLPFASREIAREKLQGCPCAYEGAPHRHALATALINAIGGMPFPLAAESKVLYHASASIASNFFVTLLATAESMLAECGIPPDQTLPLLLPLVRATLDNVAAVGTGQGLTGPIVRGDKETISQHLTALAKQPELSSLYRLLAGQTILLAETSSRLTKEQSTQLRGIITQR